MLRKLRQYNITILVSTPYMDEAMRCDRVALIQGGKILSVDQPERIRDGFTSRLFTVKAADKYRLILSLRKYPETNTAYPFGDSVHVTFINNRYDESLLSFLKSEGIENVNIEESKAGIEDRFLELMEA
jgi:ABC-type multidrug transport system ATPase subunit